MSFISKYALSPTTQTQTSGSSIGTTDNDVSRRMNLSYLLNPLDSDVESDSPKLSERQPEQLSINEDTQLPSFSAFGWGSIFNNEERHCEGYDGDTVNGTAHGYGMEKQYQRYLSKGHVIHSAVFYEGQFVNGKHEGYGILTVPDGDSCQRIFKGTFYKGQPHGIGELLSKGEAYRGQIVKGKGEGYGILTASNGYSYEGSVLNGRAHGVGVMRWKKETHSGSYTGNFEQGQPQGNGIEKRYYQYFSNGILVRLTSCYEGQFEKGKCEGYGTLTTSNGGSYKGAFHNGKPHGKGEWRPSSESKYMGNFVNGRRAGFGTEVSENGRIVYQGGFLNGKYHGWGTLMRDGEMDVRCFNKGICLDPSDTEFDQRSFLKGHGLGHL